ncbi:MAG: AI-2E family transporter [Clostridia bacterium]|nr:AI-2E family transporter [Clostridia bacterium]
MKTETKKHITLFFGIFLLFLAIRYWDSLMTFFGVLFNAASPLLTGCVAAYILNILMSWYERHWFPQSKRKAIIKTRRIICLLFAILTLIVIIALVVALVIPQLWDAIELLLGTIPGVMQKIVAWVEELHILPEDIFAMLEKIDWKSQITKILNAVTSGVGSVVDVAFGVVGSVFSGVVDFLLAAIFALYLLLGKEKIAGQCSRVMTRYLKPRINNAILYVLRTVNDCFHKYIVGQCTEAVILGLLCTIGMLLFRFPYATMIGALVAFTALIPIAGAYIGAGVGAFMIMTVSPMQAVLFLVYIVILQQLEGNIIYPRVVGSSIGLPGIWVLAAVTVGGGVMGIPGMLLGVPLAAALYRLLRDDVSKGTNMINNLEKENA